MTEVARNLINERAEKFAALLRSMVVTDLKGTELQGTEQIPAIKKLFVDTQANSGNIFVIGNGGSAAVASHIVNDLFNAAGMRAHSFNDPSMLTCLANDYGYENVFSRQISGVAKRKDLLVAISSSGTSPNIINAAQKMAEIGGKTLTLTGFDRRNCLRRMGDMNLWLNSSNYGLVEVGHLFVLHQVTDLIGEIQA